MKNEPLPTRISTFDEKRAAVRGKNLVDERIGEVSFTQMIYLHILKRVAANGMRQIRISDPSNTTSNWERLVGNAKSAGLRIEKDGMVARFGRAEKSSA